MDDKRFRCKIGLHKYKPSGWMTERSETDPCTLEIVEVMGSKGWMIPIPMEHCIYCDNERRMFASVIPSAEAEGPFAMPIFDCQCGKGNEVHEREWDAMIEHSLDRVKQMRQAIKEKNHPHTPPGKSVEEDGLGRRFT